MDITLTRRTVASAALVAAGLGVVHRGREAVGQSGSGDPVSTAVSQSQFEVTNNIYALYRQMHSDSRELVPLYAVQYWYDNDFLPRGPEVIEPTGVRYVEWTWDVTGTTYPGTAEVSFTQAFADGSSVDDVVRLVLKDGRWCWFFGRSQAFVDEQIALASRTVFPDDPVPADGWIAAIVGSGEDALDRLPQDYPGDAEASLTTGAGPGGGRGRRYVVPDEGYVLGAVDFQSFSPNNRAKDVLQDRLDLAARGPAFEVHVWDLSDDAVVVYATYTAFANDAVGNVVFTIVASDATGVFWTVTAMTRDALDAMGEALAG